MVRRTVYHTTTVYNNTPKTTSPKINKDKDEDISIVGIILFLLLIAIILFVIYTMFNSNSNFGIWDYLALNSLFELIGSFFN